MTALDLDTALDRLIDAETALDELAALAHMRKLIDRQIAATVHVALRAHSATDIGAALGITRQAVSKRFAERKSG